MRGRRSRATTEPEPSPTPPPAPISVPSPELLVEDSDEPVVKRARRGRPSNAWKAAQAAAVTTNTGVPCGLASDYDSFVDSSEAQASDTVFDTQFTATQDNAPNTAGKHDQENRKIPPALTSGIIDEEPFGIARHLVVKYRDQSQRVAKIIDATQRAAGWSYYIHYLDFNRRMDEWVDRSRIISSPSIADVLAAEHSSSHQSHQRPVSHQSPSPEASPSQEQESPIKGNGMKRVDTFTTIAELEHDEHEGMDEVQLREHEAVTKVKNVQRVQFGRHIMECWYFSPLPLEIFQGSGTGSNGSSAFIDCLYFCEFSLRFFASEEELRRFQKRGFSDGWLLRHPPGHEIYRDNQLSVFELDGALERIYCQNLCYLAKLFLDHKTLFWDVDAFVFYVICTRDSRGFHPVGYFSKEKVSENGYNLACILTLPSVQRQGYGRFIIDFSYALSQKEEKFGSPEKPLSDLGALGYKSYWAATLVRVLRDRICAQPELYPTISIVDLATWTSIQPEDIVQTLISLQLLVAAPPSTGNNDSDTSSTASVSVVESTTSTAPPALVVPPAEDPLGVRWTLQLNPQHLDQLLVQYPEGRHKVQAQNLHWTPFLSVDGKKDKWSLQYLRQSTSTAGGGGGMGLARTTSAGGSSAGGGYGNGTPSVVLGDQVSEQQQ